MRQIKEAASDAAQCFRSVALLLCVALTSGCGLGSYFLDDGLRIAHDAKTGEYIGELIGERRATNGQSEKEATRYQIRRKDGSTVEMSAEEVKLSQP